MGVKLQMPKGVTSISHKGIGIPVSGDGCAEVPADFAAHMKEAFGATEYVERQPKGKADDAKSKSEDSKGK